MQGYAVVGCLQEEYSSLVQDSYECNAYIFAILQLERFLHEVNPDRLFVHAREVPLRAKVIIK
jgi:hypothetical protein